MDVDGELGVGRELHRLVAQLELADDGMADPLDAAAVEAHVVCAAHHVRNSSLRADSSPRDPTGTVVRVAAASERSCATSLVAVFAAAGSTMLHGSDLLAHRIGVSLPVGAVMLALAMVIALVVRPRTAANVVAKGPVAEHLAP
jgi:hypothetical protein